MRAEKKKKKSIFLRVALLAFSVYVLVMLVQLQLQLRERNNQHQELQEQIEKIEMLNEDLENKKDNLEAYQEQQARENGKVRPGEQIYKEVHKT